MSKLYTKNFHIMEGVKPEHGQHCFILGCWSEQAKLVGVQFGLLCEEGNGIEIYICVSYNFNHDSWDNFKALKVDYLFFAQRDAYRQPSGIADMLVSQFLPEGDYFEVSETKPVYIKVGIVSPKTSNKYDAFANLYYR